MKTTIAVAVTLKVDVEGNSASEVMAKALEVAMEIAEAGTHQFFTHSSVEGATLLVNEAALVRQFA
jgi:hypothetical protein